MVKRAPGKDSDGDQYPDDLERNLPGLDPARRDAPRLVDTDRDGLLDVEEERLGTDPENWDTDGDLVADSVEYVRGASPTVPGRGPSMSLPDPPKVEITQVRDDARIADFLEQALAQVGDRYQRGVEASIHDVDPDKFDGSELVEWAANRSGVMINDGPANQFRQMTAKGTAIPVDQALETPGAILYEFEGDPASPTRASTAISLGDGNVIDIDPTHGVRIRPASEFTFTHAGTMPGFVDGAHPDVDSTAVRQEAYERWGIDPTDPSTFPEDPGRVRAIEEARRTADEMTEAMEQGGLVDPAEAQLGPASPSGDAAAPSSGGVAPGGEGTGAAATAARAAELRKELLDRLAEEERSFREQVRAAERDVATTNATFTSADQALRSYEDLHAFDQTVIPQSEQRARELEAAGKAAEATEVREGIARLQVLQGTTQEHIDDLRAERDQAARDVVDAQRRVAAVSEAETVANNRRVAAEAAIDQLEEKARLLQEGRIAEAAAIQVDESAIAAAGLGGTATATTSPGLATDPGDPTGAQRVEHEVRTADEGTLAGKEAQPFADDGSADGTTGTEPELELELETTTASDGAAAGLPLEPTVEPAPAIPPELEVSPGYDDGAGDFAPPEEPQQDASVDGTVLQDFDGGI